jgi:hypothetical protein
MLHASVLLFLVVCHAHANWHVFRTLTISAGASLGQATTSLGKRGMAQVSVCHASVFLRHFQYILGAKNSMYLCMQHAHAYGSGSVIERERVRL